MAQRVVVLNGRPRAAIFGSDLTPADLSEKLPEVSPLLYRQVRAVLERNKSERHIRGGMATKAKFAKQ